ncbi:MAG: hypothetical protein ACRDK1_09370 [Solirubrobacterales bacterium]
MWRVRATAAVLVATIVVALGAAPSAGAKDPGRWLMTGASSIPVPYWQGLTSNLSKSKVFFVGVFQGLWRTTPDLLQTGGVGAEIPKRVTKREGYNHIGDPTWDRLGGGRVILPMECYTPGVGNTCGTGAFGVADPATLDFRYYVKLDPAEIPKAMWAETSPDGRLIWTSSGDDLLAYRASDVAPRNNGSTGRVIHAVRRLPDAVPPTGITGAAFWKGQLLLAGSSGDVYQVWSVNTRTGERRLAIEQKICGESEGLDLIPTLGGALHWLIAPSPSAGCKLTYGPTSALLHFTRAPAHDRYRVQVTEVDAPSIPGEVQATVQATFQGQPLRNTRVTFAGGAARTDGNGIATVITALEQPGRFKAFARNGSNYGLSSLVPVGLSKSAKRASAARAPAR